MDRATAFNLLKEWTKSPSLLRHALTVSWVMEAYADKLGEDQELWAQTGLLHDADYEAFPELHPNKIVEKLRGLGQEDMAYAISAHYTKWGVVHKSKLDKALLACDELTGFIVACAQVRPQGLVGMQAKSVRKKLKQKSFAAKVERDEIHQGVYALFEVELNEHIDFIIGVLQQHEKRFGLMKAVRILLVCWGVSIIHLAQGQDDIDGFLEANLEDAGQLTVNYLEPLIKGVGYGLNNGWYNTAKPHIKGFDITITATPVFIPDEDQFSTFVASDYNDLELVTPSNGKVPTVFGPEDIEPLYRIPSNGETFTGPAGNSLEDEFGFNAVPMPMVTFGVGVIPNLDIKLRFLPITDFGDDVDLKMWGVGLLHKVNQYFSRGDQLLVDISIFGGYTHVSSEISLEGNYPGNDQIGAYSVNAWTLEGVVSHEIKFITLYGALGYNQVKSNLDVLGNYQVDSEVITDPISESFSYSGMKLTAGFRLKLAIVSLHADYSLSDYNTLTVGLGLSVN